MAELRVPSLDFSPLGNLGQVYQKAQNEAGMRDALSNGIGNDPQSLSALASRVMPFNPQMGMSLAQLGQTMASNQQAQTRDARDFGFRQQEAQRTQQNADRTFGLQQRQLTEKPTIQKIKDAAGNESLVQVFPDGRTKPLDTDGTGTRAQPNNPFAPDGKQTEGQANASLYARRMFESEKVLRDPAVEKAAQSAWERGKAMLPGAGTFYNPNTTEFKKYDQAQRDFINATLRRESGAVISEQEFDNAKKQYFPAPGDPPELLAQKRANRMEAIKGIAGAAGPAYRAPYTFDQGGNMQPYAPAPAQRGQQPVAAPPPQAVEALRANPQRAAEFDAKFGPGASARLLGGQ